MSPSITALPKARQSESVPNAEAGRTHQHRFLQACKCQPVDRTPVWFMRQAGRALPEYRALKEKHSFLELIHTPELAAEVTLQPVRRFHFDAAILFSDILVVPEALGEKFEFPETGGVRMTPFSATSREIASLAPGKIEEQLGYVRKSIPLIKQSLGGEHALIGFAGSPWTLANFMLEGGSAKEYTRAKRLFFENRQAFDQLMEKLSQAVLRSLLLQIEAGVDAVQIFDSLGGVSAGNLFHETSCRWMKRIIDELPKGTPVIVFARGTNANWKDLAETGAHVLSVDWTVPLGQIRQEVPATIGLQGNLDPFLLQTTPELVAEETRRILEEMRGRPGHIFNLGHGVPATAKLETIAAVVQTIQSFR